MNQWKKLHFEESDLDRVTVFRLRGILTSSPESFSFLERLQERVHAGRNRVVLNLEGVESLTSAGVGILAACYTSVTNARGKITLAKTPERAESILKVVHLFELIGSCGTEEEAARAVS